MTKTCKDCGAEIVFAKTNKGHWMPLDPQPNPAGNVAAYRDIESVVRCRVVTQAEPILPYEHPAMPHKATCAGPPAAPPITNADGTLSLSAARQKRRRDQRRRPI